MIELTLAEVAEIVGGVLLHADAETRVHTVVTDTREGFGEGALFVALEGPNFDAHRFVDQALKAGAVAALVETAGEGDRPMILVDDTLRALQALAATNRERFAGPVIAITGSNGKTIVKEMLAAICARRWTVHRSPGSYNSQVGVALTLLGVEAAHDLAIVEAGISEIGEMERLEAMIRPTHGVLTNVGLAHQAGLRDLQTTGDEKLKLFARVRHTPVIPATLASTRPKLEGIRFDVERPERRAGPAAEVSVRWPAAHDPNGSTFSVTHPDGTIDDIRLNVVGNLQNAAAAIAMALQLGLSEDEIRNGLATFSLSPMRLEIHTTPDGVTLINDAYSSDPVSARVALNVLDRYGAGARRIAILGDMLDLGAKSEQLHRGLGRALRCQELVCVGPLARQIGEGAIEEGFNPASVHFAATIDDAEDIVHALVAPGDVILFKGSRTLGLERVAERLLESVSPSKLIIDLDAILQNYQAIRTRIGSNTAVMAIVKSFAYGSDSTRVSQMLAGAGIDALGVAYPDEAIPLHRRGLALPIVVTNALEREADKIVKYNLTPLVCSLEVVTALQRWAERLDRHVDVHLEIDSGMNRLGIRPEHAVAFADEIGALERVQLRGAMTHFAAADDPEEDDFTRLQYTRFADAVLALREAGHEIPVLHVSNTAGAWRFPELDVSMVRIGLGLYGAHPSVAVGDVAKATKHALVFKTEVTHVKVVPAGESVSYGRTWTAPEDRVIATIAAGYNDGFPRLMSNGGEVLIGGQRCPVVGSVCMDASMVDVTDAGPVQVGDEVVLFGGQGDQYIWVDEIAERAQTVNYEVLCKISPRVRRIFLRSH